MYEIKMKFWCNAGYTEKEVKVPIHDNCGTEDEQIQAYFETWLDNNEDDGIIIFKGKRIYQRTKKNN